MESISKFLIFVVIAVSSLCVSTGCDQYRDERQRLQSESRDIESRQAAVADQRSKVVSELAVAQTRRNELAAQLASAVAQQAQRAKNHATYLSDNKAAVAAVAAAAAGAMMIDQDVATFIHETGGEAATGLTILAGVTGVGYCLFNSKECADVVSRLSEITTEKKEAQQSVAKLNEIDTTASEVLPALQQKLSQLDREGASLQQQFAPVQARLVQIKCSGVFC